MKFAGKLLMMFTYLLLWFAMLLIAIVNGTLRDLWYKNFLGELRAHQLSTGTLILFFSVFFVFVLRRFPPASSTQAVLIGFSWLALTVGFEFGFGRWRGRTWRELLQDYDIGKGRLWPLVLIWVTVAPYLFYRWPS